MIVTMYEVMKLFAKGFVERYKQQGFNPSVRDEVAEGFACEAMNIYLAEYRAITRKEKDDTNTNYT